jgi:UDP-N-acetylmuramoyl-L-alanyl-D-glutamate--2,6-diaminopimelate ligase
VTGTNGKTTTTAWAAAALRAGTGAPVVRATTVGVFIDDERLDVAPTYDGFLAAMRAGLDRGGRAAAIELTSEALAVGFATAWPVEVGVFTNLTHDHLDAHGSPEHYLASKAQLFVHLRPGGAAVLNGRDPASSLLAEVLPAGVRAIFFGAPNRLDSGPALDLEAVRVEPGWHGTRISLRVQPPADPSGLGGLAGRFSPSNAPSSEARVPPAADPCGLAGRSAPSNAPSLWSGLPASFSVRAIGEVYAENALAALAAAVAFGVPADVAAAAIEAAPPPPGRFEVVAERPYLVVDYAHSPDALERAVRTARLLSRGLVTVVFGAGGERDREKRAPMGRAARAADRVIVTADNPRREDPAAIIRAICQGLEGHGGVEIRPDRGEAIAAAVRDAGPDDVVLVAGRGPETEQIFADGPRPFSDVAVLRSLVAHTGS